MTILAVFAAGVAAGVVGLITVAVHREEHNHTLVRLAPDRVTRAARWLNGVHVLAPDIAAEASSHQQQTPV